MSIERLERVMWRLDKCKTNEDVMLSQIRHAIMKECGTDPLTIKNNIKTLIELKWLKRKNRYAFTITGEHLQ